MFLKIHLELIYIYTCINNLLAIFCCFEKKTNQNLQQQIPGNPPHRPTSCLSCISRKSKGSKGDLKYLNGPAVEMDGLQLEHMKQRLWLGYVYQNMYSI